MAGIQKSSLNPLCCGAGGLIPLPPIRRPHMAAAATLGAQPLPSESSDVEEDVVAKYFNIKKFNAEATKFSLGSYAYGDAATCRRTVTRVVPAAVAVPQANTHGGMMPRELAQPARVDPYQTERILTRRQSAMRSKQRDINYMNYIKELENNILRNKTSLAESMTTTESEYAGVVNELSNVQGRLRTLEERIRQQEDLMNGLDANLYRVRSIGAGVAGRRHCQPPAHG